MSPENANIFLVEDNKSKADNARYFLEKGGHHIIIEAGTLEKAVGLASKLNELGG